MNAHDILKNTTSLAFEDVPKIPGEQMYLLSDHSKASVRLAAVNFAPRHQLPFFVNDTHPDVMKRVAERLKGRK